MSDLEHLIENAVCAVESGNDMEDFRANTKTQPLLEATGMKLEDVFQIAVYIVCTLKNAWHEEWEDDLKEDAGSPSTSESTTQSGDIHADTAASHAPQSAFDGEPIKLHHPMTKWNYDEYTGYLNGNVDEWMKEQMASNIAESVNSLWRVSHNIYRGKRDDNGELVYGSLIVYPDGDMYIAAPTVVPWCLNKYKVIPETVGGWTGMRDVNNKPIFEGDVIRHYDRLVGYSEYDHYEIGRIVWNPSEARYEQHRKNGRVYGLGACCRYEVTGNIHTIPF